MAPKLPTSSLYLLTRIFLLSVLLTCTPHVFRVSATTSSESTEEGQAGRPSTGAWAATQGGLGRVLVGVGNNSSSGNDAVSYAEKTCTPLCLPVTSSNNTIVNAPNNCSLACECAKGIVLYTHECDGGQCLSLSQISVTPIIGDSEYDYVCVKGAMAHAVFLLQQAYLLPLALTVSSLLF